MEKALFVLKPNLFNAIVPVLFKSFLRASLLGAVAFGLYWLVTIFGTIDFPMDKAIIFLVLFLLIYPMVPGFFKLLTLYNTKYIFYETHIVSEFELMNVKRHSTPYHQIVNITSKVSIWDRLCHSGDVTMHTAEDTLPDLTLFYIKNPDQIEAKLYDMIHKRKNKQKKLNNNEDIALN